MNKKIKGRFITLEGIEGVGKSTQLRFIAQYLKERSICFTLTREPGGTVIAESLRQFLLSTSLEDLVPETELLLFFAARAQHIHHVIKPALERGEWVICDRFTEASYAYQGGGRGIDLNIIRFLEQKIQKELTVDCTILLDAPVDTALHRTRERRRSDRIEAETKDFFERVRETYLLRAKEKAHIHIIDASRSLTQVQQQIQSILDKHLFQWNAVNE